MKYYNYIILFMVCTGIVSSCNNEKEKTKGTEETTAKISKVAVPDYNSDSAYQFVKQQVDFGPRVPNTMAHDLCGEFIVKKLQSFG